MSPLNALIFGLGLFFLGLKLTGENLRRLVGSGFREIIKRSTHSPLLGAALGTGAGALMQSATAVTFILVSMSTSGLIRSQAAAPIIIWCNVGLTALAFVTTLNIHPLIAYTVGGAGIILGTIRVTFWQSLAGTLLGIGLILIGLGQMSSGAAPLEHAAWFRQTMSFAVAYPPLTFLAGIGAAVLLQSNTGAAILVITFASTGFLSLEAAMLLIYGTNLGAIGLRLFLSSGLTGSALRLVRLEDLFCIFSGCVMLILYGLEHLGIPLIAAFVNSLQVAIETKLAIVFLLSNLIPALLLSPLLGTCTSFLKKLWPDLPASEDPSKPMYISSPALDDPSTALDLMEKELARLLSTITTTPPASEVDEPPPAFQKLALAIENFATKLAARGALDEATAGHLHILRAELSIVRHIEEGVRYFAVALARQKGPDELRLTLESLLTLAVRAMSNEDLALRDELLARTKLKGPEMTGLQEKIQSSSLTATALFEDFTISVWTMHRLAKLLCRLRDGKAPASIEPAASGNP
jgi:phosphate:Na+ symporter